MDEYTEPTAAGSALLTIDVQRDFTHEGAPAEIPGTWAAIPRMARLVDRFREFGRPIVHVVRLYEESGENVDACRRAAIESGDSIAARRAPTERKSSQNYCRLRAKTPTESRRSMRTC